MKIINRILLFFLGFSVGIIFDIIPGMIEFFTGINICRESCPTFLIGLSIIIYLLMPILWGLYFSKKTTLVNYNNMIKYFIISVMLMLALTWFLYAYQNSLLR